MGMGSQPSAASLSISASKSPRGCTNRYSYSGVGWPPPTLIAGGLPTMVATPRLDPTPRDQACQLIDTLRVHG
jgi:hypothetical protein